MAFKSKFKVGDYVRMNARGRNRHYAFRTAEFSTVVRTSTYWSGDRTRTQYAVSGIGPAGRKETRWFNSWELDKGQPPIVLSVEELI